MSNWQEWPNDALRQAPAQPGTYVFRLGVDISRVKGVSDIVYIGCTCKGRGTIRSRLKNHLSASANERYLLARISNEVGKLQVASKTCDAHRDANLLESNWLVQYSQDHIEFPPVNRQQSLKKFQDFAYYYKRASPEEREQMQKMLEQMRQAR